MEVEPGPFVQLNNQGVCGSLGLNEIDYVDFFVLSMIVYFQKDTNLDQMKEKERVEVLTVRALSYLGELCVIEARNRPQEISWYDRSGNLRSSIGYAIIHNGKILEYSDFTQVRQGNALIEELSKKFANGYALVVVAGMNYAEFVEAMENKNVLASAELFARKELPGMMSKLKKQLAS